MRERAELYGGVLAAGPGPDGGFIVTAVIPFPEAAGDGVTPGRADPGEVVAGGLPGEAT
jgi:hypothetical protein